MRGRRFRLAAPAEWLTRPCLILLLTAASASGQHSRARWIWYPEKPSADAVRQSRYFRLTFTVTETPTNADLWVQVDDRGTYWVNGQRLAKEDMRRGGCAGFHIATLLKAGPNVVAVEAYNAGNVGGVIARLTLTFRDGRRLDTFSDKRWRASRTEPEGWTAARFDDSAWPVARELGDAFMRPWSDYAGYDTSAVVDEDEVVAHHAAREKLMAAPERFVGERHARATIEHADGSVVVTIDGRKLPAVMYRGTIDPFMPHGRRQITNFASAGVHLFVPYFNASKLWLGPGKYDFSAVDGGLRAFLSADPEAHLVVMVRLIPPNWWMAAHESEWVRYAKTDKLDSSDEARNVKRASMASEAWLADTCAFWRALVRHVERQPWGKRVIGWHPGYGIYAEWHYFGSWTDQMPDTGPAMTRRFRAWLRARYGTLAALRQAWARPDVTFDTATVPGVEPRENGSLWSFRDPRRERWVMDYYRRQQETTRDCLEALGRIVKQETRERCLHGAYYGYFFGVRPQTQGGHLALEGLLASKDIDYCVAPFCYAYRLMGQDGRLRAGAEAFRVGGKVHVLEGDIRTHLHPRNEHGRAQDLTESIAAVRREFTTALIEGAAFWFVDFGPESQGGWFDHPAIMAEIGCLQALATRAIQKPRRRNAEVALVCDLKSAYCLTDTEGMDTAYRLVENVTTELHHTGAPFDVVFLSQLDRVAERYKLLVFLNTFRLDPEQTAMLTRLREAGRHAIAWLWAPGLIGPEGIDAGRASRVTGFDLKLLRERVPGQIRIVADSPLVAEIPKRRVVELVATRADAVAGACDPTNWHNARDEKTMRKWFRQYDVKGQGDGVVWTFDTDYHWNDVHVLAPVERCDGLALDIQPKGKWDRLRLKFVLIDADGAEFVSAEDGFDSDQWSTRRFAIAALDNAPWSKLRPERPKWPARGIKLVLSGTAGRGVFQIGVRNIERLHGEVRVGQQAVFGDGVRFGPALAARDGRVLGVAQGTTHGILASKANGRHVFLGAPFAPRQLLARIMDLAGVHRYESGGDDVVRADSGLVAVHTKAGGPREIRLPRSAQVLDALTRQPVHAGRRFQVTLPPRSTTIWTLE